MSGNTYLDALLHNWFYGNLYVRELAAVVFAALFGSIPITPVVEWLFGDLEPRIASTARGLAPVINTGKGLLPVLIATHGGGTAVGLCSAVAVVAGHCYCPWRRFEGGTGTAVFFGALLGVCPPAAAIYLVLWLVAAIASNYAITGALLAGSFSIVSLWYLLGAPAAFAGVAMFVAIAGRHRDAFVRLSENCEPTLRTRPGKRTRLRVVVSPANTSVIVVEGQAVQRV